MLKKLQIMLYTICMMIFLVGTVNANAIDEQENLTVQNNALQLEYVTGNYPTIAKADSILIKSKINTELEKVVSDFVEQIKYQNKQENIPNSVAGFISYDVKANTDEVFSVVIHCSTMFKGAAHPTTYSYGLTFDHNGNLIHFMDIIQEDKKFGKNIYTEKNLYNAILAQAGDRIFNDSIIPLKADFPKEFYLDSDKNLHLLFQQYEIAPYAAGLIDITLK